MKMQFIERMWLLVAFSLASLILTCTGARAQSTSIPMRVSDWQYASSQSGSPEYEYPPGPGVFEETGEGLKFYDYGYRGGARIVTKESYLISNVTVFVKWKVSGNGGWGFFWINIPDRTSFDEKFNWLSTQHSYAGTVVVADNQWYYTRVRINPSWEFTSVTAANNYDDQGGTVIQTLTGTLPNGSTTGKINISFEDTYAATVFTVVGEARIRTEGNPAPVINLQPSNQTVNAGGTVAFSVTADGATPLTYQWRFNGQNIASATNSSMTVPNAHASDYGGYSVRVANAAGSVVSATAHLAVLGGDTYGQTVFRRPDSPASERPPGKDSLVIVTHGWQRSWAAPNTDWVGDLVNSIDAAVSAQGNWYVESLLWETDAHTVLPQKAAQNGEEIGALRGRQIATEGWSHVHFIAHSAGSALIQAATRQIKARSPSTTVHTTFLDPFVGVTTIDRLTYGETADWADSYFAEDVTSWQTRGRLSHAHNVNVTAIDPLTKPMLVFSSTANSTPAVDTHPDSTHGWPYHFYFNTLASHRLYRNEQHATSALPRYVPRSMVVGV